MTTAEATHLLRDILVAYGVSLERARTLSSHSLKTTLLAWGAMFNIPLEVRRLLGHHVDPQHGSTVTYSRDALSGPMEHVEEMLEAIIAKTFNPDAPRSTRLADARARRAASVPKLTVVPRLRDESSDESEGKALSSSSSSGSSSQSVKSFAEDEQDQLEAAEMQLDDVERPVKRPATDLYVHRFSGLVHVLGDPRKFLCSKNLTAAYYRFADEDPLERPQCMTCARVAASRGSIA